MSDASRALAAAGAVQSILSDLRNARSLLEGDNGSLDPIAQQQLAVILNGRPQATAGPVETVRDDAHVQILAGRPMRIESYVESKQLPTADNVRSSAIDRDPRLLFNGAQFVPVEDAKPANLPPAQLRDEEWDLLTRAAPLDEHPSHDATRAPIKFTPAAQFTQRPYVRVPASTTPSSIYVEDLTANTHRIAHDVVANSFRQLVPHEGETVSQYYARTDPHGIDRRSYQFLTHPVHETIRRSVAVIESMAMEARDHHDFNPRPNTDTFRPTWKTVVVEVQNSRAARSFDQVLLAACAALFRYMNNFPQEPAPKLGDPYYSDFCDYYCVALTDSFSLRNEARLR